MSAEPLEISDKKGYWHSLLPEFFRLAVHGNTYDKKGDRMLTLPTLFVGRQAEWPNFYASISCGSEIKRYIPEAL